MSEKRKPIGRAVAGISKVNGNKVDYENVDLGAVWPITDRETGKVKGYSFTMLSMPLAWHNTSTPRKVNIWIDSEKEGIDVPVDQLDEDGFPF